MSSANELSDAIELTQDDMYEITRMQVEELEPHLAIALHFKSAAAKSAQDDGYRRGIIACSSLCGRRSQCYDEYSVAPMIRAYKTEAEACATAIRALLRDAVPPPSAQDEYRRGLAAALQAAESQASGFDAAVAIRALQARHE